MKLKNCLSLGISDPIQYRNKAGRNMQYLRLSLGSGTQLVNARTCQLHERKNIKAVAIPHI